MDWKWTRPFALGVVAGAVVFIALAGAGVLSASSWRQQQNEQRNASVLARVRKELATGWQRSEVEAKLLKEGFLFRRRFDCGAQGCHDWVYVGQEEAPWYCDSETTYVELRFNGGPRQDAEGEVQSSPGAPTDQLTAIDLHVQPGACL